MRFVLPVVPSGDSQSGDFIECNAWPAERPLPLPVLILNRYVVECLWYSVLIGEGRYFYTILSLSEESERKTDTCGFYLRGIFSLCADSFCSWVSIRQKF